MEPKPWELHKPRPRNKIPKLYVDQSRNRAFCKVDGKLLVMGPADSAEAQEAYGRLLASLARGETIEAATKASRPANPTSFTLNDLMLRFRTEEMPRYSVDEQWCLKSAVAS
jgi:hypothetical protein